MPYTDTEKQKAAHRKYYRENRERYNTRRREQKRRLHRKIQEKKEATPCTDCGKRYPFYVMQFDHVRGKKKDNVSIMVRSGAALKVEKEIEKCEIVCANCHAERTHGVVA